MTPEGRVKAHVARSLERLVYPGSTVSPVYRFAPVQNGMGAPALDLFNCINGRFVAIESKAPGKKPTPRQENTIAQIDRANGLHYVVSTVPEIAAMIAEICNLCHVEYVTRMKKETTHDRT